MTDNDHLVGGFDQMKSSTPDFPLEFFPAYLALDPSTRAAHDRAFARRLA